MTENRKVLLQFINENLEYGDNKIIGDKLGVDPKFVSKVRTGLESSRRVLAALELKAMENKQHALKIAEYHNKSVNF